jgi:ParB family chromosome partitioning protein
VPAVATAISVSAVPLPVECLRPSPLNTRRQVDPKRLEELTESVRMHGVLQPLLVRPIDGGKKFEVVFGHRRLAAAKAAKLPDVPCSVRELTDQQAIEMGLVENVQRQDMHPLDEADGYRRLMKEAGYDVPAIADKVKKSASYVYQKLKLAELVPEAAEAFGADTITEGHAVQIARLQPKYQKEALAECFGHEWAGPGSTRQERVKILVSVRALGRWIAENVHLDLAAAPWKKDDATLVKAAGPCTTCPKRTGFVPDLFPDIAKKDTCTDRGCFGQKLDAHLGRIRDGLKEKGTAFVEVSREYTGRRDPKGPLDPQRWTEAKGKGCAHAKAGLVVGGQGRGQVVKICAEPGCKVHGHGMSRMPGPTPREKARQKEAHRRHRVELAYRRRLLDAVLAKVPPTLGPTELSRVAPAYMQEVWHENRVRVMRRHGWIPEKGRPAGSQDHLQIAQKKLGEMAPAELGRILVELSLVRVLDVGGYDDRKKDVLALAKRYRVDLAALQREPAKPKPAAKKGKK